MSRTKKRRYLLGAGLSFIAFLGVILLAAYYFGGFSSFGGPLKVNTTMNGCYDYKSINGFGLFTDLIRSQKGKVAKKSIISPGLRRSDLIIWAHKGSQTPSEEAFRAVEKHARDGRADVWFFHNDWNNKTQFLDQIYRNASNESREAARFYLQQERSDIFSKGFQSPFQFFPFEQSSGHMVESSIWFDIQPSHRHMAKIWKLESSDPAQPASLQNATFQQYSKLRHSNTGTEAKPVSYTGSFLVPSLSKPAQTKGGGRNSGLHWIKQGGVNILLVSDPSFVSNYGILQPENKELVQSLVDNLPSGSFNVQFLETGPLGIVVSDEESTRKQKLWKWMGMGNLPLVVINALIIAVLFCFSRLPIFGLPAKFSFQHRNDMKDHLVEVGKMLEESTDNESVDQTIRHYYQMSRSSPVGKRSR